MNIPQAAMDSAATQALIARAAEALITARASGVPAEPVRKYLPAKDVAMAYAVQDAVTTQGLSEGRRLIGRKIGLTSRSVQRQIGVDQPDYGMLFSDLLVLDGDVVPHGALIAPKVEAEIAFVLKEPLDLADASVTDVIRATDYILPAIEIVDTRISAWDIDIVDTVADNASSGLFVLGNQPVGLPEVDLRLAGMVTERNGEAESFGAGIACLGHPIHAVLWLARKMVEVGRPLGAGDVVLSGALGPMLEARPGDHFETRIASVGSVRVSFASSAR